MRAFKVGFVALVAVVSLQEGTRAQNLTLSLFERSLDQLRQEAGIPGLSVAIVQGRSIAWDAGLGLADVERSIPARPDTPYPIGDLTQTFAATLVLQRVEHGDFELQDRIGRWTTLVSEPGATVDQVLRHTSTGAFRYDPSRFAALTPLIEYYPRRPFRKVLADDILTPLAMRDSVPGHDMEDPPALDRPFFDAGTLDRYADVLRRLAVPYRVDARRRATRSEYPARSITAGTGLISTVRDLAKFDAGLSDDDLLLAPPLRALMWTRSAPRVPTGLGWFVQSYNGEPLVWHFGVSSNAFSSLMLKVPNRDLTLILLANSDGLSAPFALGNGDVTTSLFARLFLRLFVG